MVKTSKLFHSLVAVFVILIIGLTAAIFYQRQEGDKARLKARLENDGDRMDVITGKAKTITGQLPLLRERMERLEGQWAQAQPLIYHQVDFPEIESILGRAASGAQFTLNKIETATINDGELFREHVFNVRMVGPMTNLPAFADAFYKQRRLAMIDRISVVSPDYLFQKVRIKVTVHYFESNDPEQLVPQQLPIERFQVPLDYVADQQDTADPVYGQALAIAQQKAGTLSGLKDGLQEAEKLERRIAALSKLLTGLKEIDRQVDVNKKTVTQNLPTLYIKVRNSPLGSVALLVQGNSPRFPEVTVDD